MPPWRPQQAASGVVVVCYDGAAHLTLWQSSTLQPGMSTATVAPLLAIKEIRTLGSNYRQRYAPALAHPQPAGQSGHRLGGKDRTSTMHQIDDSSTRNRLPLSLDTSNTSSVT
uniref:Uncharacterized protein n=1 Tax=Plectus sambesii TaxID=2011161 RepID=A0A914WZD5_9BILA